MKQLLKTLAVLLLVFITTSVKAQSDERNKIQMVVKHEGKTITTDLTSFAMGITRYKDVPDASIAASPATKEKSIMQGNYYLTLSVKKSSDDLLRLLAKKQTVFSGTITITDTYGKNPPREIRFADASLENYSDQFSTASYDDMYSSTAITMTAKGLTVNGIVME